MLSYLLIFPPVIAYIGLGRRFIKHDMFSALIAGLLIMASVVGPLAYWQVAWVKPALLVGLFFGSIFIAGDLWSAWREQHLELISFRKIAGFVIAFIFFLVFFRGLQSTMYVYEAHDLVYFSWINEVFMADYSGPIRVGVAWPHPMASNHLLPGGMVAALSVLLPHPSLITSIEIRYLLVSASFAYFLVTLAPSGFKEKVLFGILCFLVFSIYREEIAFDLRISSFAYVIILFEVLRRILKQDGEDRELVFFAILLTIAKAPIFFVSASLATWFLLKAPQSRYTWTTLCAVALSLLNIATWGLAPPPGGENLSWSIAHPFNSASIGELASVAHWMMPDSITELLKHVFEMPFLTLPMVLYVIAKYYIIYFVAVDRVRHSASTNVALDRLSMETKLCGLDVLILVSLLAWVFVRNGTGIAHQVHSYLLIAVVTMSVLLRALTVSRSPVGLAAAILCAFIFAARVDLTDPFQYINTHISEESYAMTYAAGFILPETHDGFYHPPAGEPPGVSQVKSAMAGLRLLATEAPPPKDSVIYNWILQ